MKHVWTTLSILLAAGVLTPGQSPGGGTAPPAKVKPLIEDCAQMMVTPPPASAILEKVYPGHHIPADIYYGRNIKPAPRRQ